VSCDYALDVRNLTVSLSMPAGNRAKVIDDVSFAIPYGGALCIVGESSTIWGWSPRNRSRLIGVCGNLASGLKYEEADDHICQT